MVHQYTSFTSHSLQISQIKKMENKLNKQGPQFKSLPKPSRTTEVGFITDYTRTEVLVCQEAEKLLKNLDGTQIGS